MGKSPGGARCGEGRSRSAGGRQCSAAAHHCGMATPHGPRQCFNLPDRALGHMGVAGKVTFLLKCFATDIGNKTGAHIIKRK